MKICILYDKSGNLDEGMKRVGFELSRELSKRYSLLELDLNHFVSPNFWRRIDEFSPDVVHFIPGITLKSVVMLRILRSLYNVRTTITALVPRLGRFSLYVLKTFRPNLIFALSTGYEMTLRSLGVRERFLPLGVDLGKFEPEHDLERKALIRKGLGVDAKKFTVLHVGHVNEGRNVETLSDIAGLGCQVIFVATTSTKPDFTLLARLKKAGVVVLRTFFKNIEDVYKMADSYVFPTIDDRYAVNIPLSVLEAMACNLPVVTTRFGGLPRMFREGAGLLFSDTEEGILQNVERVRNDEVEVATREIVCKYSWSYVAELFDKCLRELLNS